MNSIKRQRRHNRIRKVVRGTAVRPRASVYRSASRVMVQLIDDEAGRTLVGLTTKSTAKKTKTEEATELGKKIAKAAKDLKVENVVFDRGGYRYHGRVKAVAEAMREAGLNF